ncbi:MAG TPA: hypothetical protein VL098_14395 [Flavipsychrobacter sp.]|nr:hypothetical protein [Flavipsychrobacter sp.]
MSLRLYHTVQLVEVPKEKISLARKFSLDVAPTTNYTDSNQYSREKIQDDHFISKIGEEAVVQVMKRYGQLSGPDYTIYVGKSKSWLHDLEMNHTGIAVKTQRRTAAEHYGLSWTFQYGKGRKDSLLQQPDAWVVFVEYNDRKPYECRVFPPYQVKELTFKEPRRDYLRNSKKVVYASTLPPVSIP